MPVAMEQGPVGGRLLTTGAPVKNSTSPRAVVVAAGLVEPAAGLAERVPLVEQAAALRLALREVVVRAQLAAARGQPVAAPRAESALARGRPESVAGPALRGQARGGPEPQVPGSDPERPEVVEVREALRPQPAREAQAVRVARTSLPYWISRGPIWPRARSSRRRLARKACCEPWSQRACGRLRSCWLPSGSGCAPRPDPGRGARRPGRRSRGRAAAA